MVTVTKMNSIKCSGYGTTIVSQLSLRSLRGGLFKS